MKYIKINEHDVNIKAIECVSGIKEEKDIKFEPDYKLIPTGRFYFSIITFSGSEFNKMYSSKTEASINRQAFMEQIK